MDYIRNNMALLGNNIRNRKVFEMDLHQGI